MFESDVSVPLNFYRLDTYFALIFQLSVSCLKDFLYLCGCNTSTYMEKVELTERLSSRIGIEDAMGLRGEVVMSHSTDLLFSLCASSDAVVARNAAWVLTQFSDGDLAMLLHRQGEITDLVLRTPNTSLRRLLLSVLYRMPFRGDDIRVDLLDFCLENMVAAHQPPGVQSLCMKMAHRMCAPYPELEAEFLRTIKDMNPYHYSAAVTSARKNILAGMKKHRRAKTKQTL